MVPTSAKTPYKKINRQIRKYIKTLVFGGFYAGNNKSLWGEIRGFRAFHSPRNQLAKLSGVSIRTIQHFESRNRDIDGAHLDILLDLCMALNCGLCDILESKNLINKVEQVVYYL